VTGRPRFVSNPGSMPQFTRQIALFRPKSEQ
jgi:hypothetical protein